MRELHGIEKLTGHHFNESDQLGYRKSLRDICGGVSMTELLPIERKMSFLTPKILAGFRDFIFGAAEFQSSAKFTQIKKQNIQHYFRIFRYG